MGTIGQPISSLVGSSPSPSSNIGQPISSLVGSPAPQSGNAKIVETPVGYGVVVNGVRIDKTPTLTQEQAQAQVNAINNPQQTASQEATKRNVAVPADKKVNVLGAQHGVIRAPSADISQVTLQEAAIEANRQYIAASLGIPANAVTNDMLASLGPYSYSKRVESSLEIASSGTPTTISYIPNTYAVTISQTQATLPAPGKIPQVEQKQEEQVLIGPTKFNPQDINNLIPRQTRFLASEYPNLFTSEGTIQPNLSATEAVQAATIAARQASGILKVKQLEAQNLGEYSVKYQLQEPEKPVTWFGETMQGTEGWLQRYDALQAKIVEDNTKHYGTPGTIAAYTVQGLMFPLQAYPRLLIYGAKTGGGAVGYFAESSVQAARYTAAGDFKSRLKVTPAMKEYAKYYSEGISQAPGLVSYVALSELTLGVGGMAAKAGHPLIGSALKVGGQGALTGAIQYQQAPEGYKESAFVGGFIGGSAQSYLVSIRDRPEERTPIEKFSMAGKANRLPFSVDVALGEPAVIRPEGKAPKAVSVFGVSVQENYNAEGTYSPREVIGKGFTIPYSWLNPDVPIETVMRNTPTPQRVVFPEAQAVAEVPRVRAPSVRTTPSVVLPPMPRQKVKYLYQPTLYEETEQFDITRVSMVGAGLRFNAPPRTTQREQLFEEIKTNTRTLNIERLNLKAEQMLELSQKQNLRLGLGLGQKLNQSTKQRLEQEQELKTALQTEILQQQRLTPRQVLTPRVRLKLRLKNPPTERPPGTSVNFKDVFGKKAAVPTIKVPKQPFGYAPSFTASAFSIKGYVPKNVLSGKLRLTGVEFRPIPTIGKTIRKAFKQKRRR